MRLVIVLLGVVFTFSLSTNTVNACSCAGTGSVCQSFGTATAVFVGTVVSARENRFPAGMTLEERRKQADRTGDDWAPRAFKFSVEQTFLGVGGTDIEVFTGSGGGDCGFEFKVGQRYLVYAYQYKERLITTICTRTKPFVKADEDLALLGNLPSAAPGVTILGEVTHPDLKGEALSSNVLITIEGDSERKEIRLDAEGHFRVSGLRPGKYKVALVVPETLVASYQPEREFKVADHGCAAIQWDLTDNGRITGQVVNAEGEPVARIVVGLVRSDRTPKDDYMKVERTDEQGRFTFSAVPRGRYVIAINHDRYPDPTDPTNAYPPSFHPGVMDQAQAQVITVGAGEG